ncbi:hypothetical protein [Glycomyces algeriensis]|uniref:DUF3267 domain-containing protein n=1 Tax=Glycomyces algeriensis TaxID=256037 RepID=A0A9W6LI54_9ACTN|nr:hypothetical protein [Glycomyces algeriensis]MDA1365592.1 hypothetical protein [Glycomyces algeriensis]MDR7351280.1 hypothetical protein [Glycomyces algeriensis]GLI43995.1 hypothetical protein GALLR39Z86_38450 [Glycomyces algeriensis]
MARTTYPPGELRILRVAWTVAASVWPLAAFLGLLTLAALAWWARSGDSGLVLLALLCGKTGMLGLVASFALHESAHAAVLKTRPGITAITVEATAWRISLIPEGTLTRGENALVALAGPLACAAVGAGLWLTGIDRLLAWWYLLHLAFLLPVFGDGQALWRSFRGARAAPHPHP